MPLAVTPRASVLGSLALLLGLALMLPGCLGTPYTHPPGAHCAAFLHDAEGGVVSDTIARIAARRAAARGPAAPVTINMLILSGGGKYGAYGAGFLSGWSRREADGQPVDMRRQDVDIVTGISTGSLLASYAAAGNSVPAADPARAAADSDMRAAYQVSDKDLFVTHGLVGSLGSNALADPAKGLQVRVEALARAYMPKMRALADGRAVLVGLVNLDNGRFYIADLVEIARSDAANAVECYREVLLASSAVPLQFPPRYIDGSPYVDGGVRFGTFLGRDFAALAGGGGGEPAMTINFRAIVNGNLSANDPADNAAQAAACDAAELDAVPSTCAAVKNRLLNIAERAAGNILADQIYRDSAYRLYRDLQSAGLLGSGAYAYVSNRDIADHHCKRATGDTFDRVYMDCLSAIGIEEGTAQHWQSFADLPKLRRPVVRPSAGGGS